MNVIDLFNAIAAIWLIALLVSAGLLLSLFGLTIKLVIETTWVVVQIVYYGIERVYKKMFSKNGR